MRHMGMGAGVKARQSKRPAVRPQTAPAPLVASSTDWQGPAAERHAAAAVQEEADPIYPSDAADAAQGTAPGIAEMHPDTAEAAAKPGDGGVQTGAGNAAATAWGPADRILIEIDPIVSAGFIGQRYELKIRGWVVATAAVEEVVLFHGDTFVSQVQYGPPGPTARVVLPDGTTVTRHVFTLSLPRSRAEAGGPCTFSITARTVNNQSHRETYSLMSDPLLPTQVEVESGPTRSSADYASELAPVILVIERAALDVGGYLQLTGWVVSLGAVVAMQVFVGEDRISAPKLGLRRDDVASAFPSYPDALHAGFTL